MKQFRVYQAPSGGGLYAVKQGWSWPGFFFVGLWALVKKLWLIGLGLLFCGFWLGSMTADADLESELGSHDFLFLGLEALVHVLCGLYGNRWREEKLIRQGYQYQRTLFADNPLDAVVQCIDTMEESPREAVHDPPARG